VKKKSSCTWIEVNNDIHTFLLNDEDCPQALIEILAELKRLFKQMHDAGYHVPDMEFVLCDLWKEGKVVQLCHHSEKLAIAFGLTSTSSGTPLHITKESVCMLHLPQFNKGNFKDSRKKNS
jgi:hypothetical protein